LEYINEEFLHLQKRKVITNVNQVKKDSLLVYGFDINPNRILPLNTIIVNRTSDESHPDEKYIYIHSDSSRLSDTILYLVGYREVVNKFERRDKLFNLVFFKTYIYYFQ
jgi:hypothetical protein